MESKSIYLNMEKCTLTLCSLHILAREACYVNNIIAELKKAGLINAEGGVFSLLAQLRKAGIVEYELISSTDMLPKKKYSLTEKGKIYKDRMTESWKELVSTTNTFIKTKSESKQKK